MCTGPERKSCLAGVMDVVEIQSREVLEPKFSVLLELAALDDLVGFRTAVEEDGRDVDESGCWYGRRIGSNKMCYEERTPLMIASMYGSKRVLNYILETGRADINRVCGSDRATALHCAVAGGSSCSLDVVKLLLDASAEVNSLDAKGNKPVDLVSLVTNSSFSSRRKMSELFSKKIGDDGQEPYLNERNMGLMEEFKDQEVFAQPASKDGNEKKEYPVDPSLPDIKNGIYATDEFRMYSFKVKPCSRAYSHDWTECPFVHPGENARRRDPRKFQYSCVPCPEFRKGTCHLGDACEYAHGIFECWLHPAQYRTRMCKDEVNCARRVCFFAHKPEELRPLFSSTGSGIPSPRSFSSGASLDGASMSQLSLGSPSLMLPPTTTPPMTPNGSTQFGSVWSHLHNQSPPTLKLPSSRLKTSVSARDMDADAELLELEKRLHQQQLMDEISRLSSRSSWNNTLANRNGELHRLGGVKPTSLDDMYGSLDPSMMTQVQSPTGMQMRQNVSQQLLSSYPSGLSSPGRASPFGFDQIGARATVLNARSASFTKRSQSFIDRSAANRFSGLPSPSSTNVLPPNLSEWGSPDGKLDWGIQKEELHKLRKSTSFGFRSGGNNAAMIAAPTSTAVAEQGSLRVQPLLRDPSASKCGEHGLDDQQHPTNGGETLAPWVEQLFMEQEKIMA